MGFEIGMNAQQLLVEIVGSNRDIDSLTVAIYKPSLSFTDRVARRLAIDAGPVDAGSNVGNQKISIEECLDHDLIEEFERRRTIDGRNFAENLAQVKSELFDDQVLAICSICKTKSGENAHIPMMDFACEVSSENLELIRFLLVRMGLEGAILESGKSYHYYGFNLVNNEEWLSMMGKFLLAAPLTDVRYVAHRILGRTSVLRISSAPQKPTIPVVKAIVGAN